MSNLQYINDDNGKPLFVVLPINVYRNLIDLAGVDDIPDSSLLSSDGTRIELPHGGPGAYIDLIQFADFIDRCGVIDMAINQRAQAYDKFPYDQLNSLDPLIRRAFLPETSPYRNTMQATTAVVDALVESGLFKRTKRSYDHYYRPVNAIETNKESLIKFFETKGHPKNPLPTSLYLP